MRKTHVVALVVLSGAVANLLWTGTAAADQNYRTQKYPVTAVDAPAARGSVINIHANGPVIYGLERYSLVGAEPSMTYQVTLTIYADPKCTTPVVVGGQPLAFPTALLTTNAVGNGHAKAVFSAQQVAPLVPVKTTVAGEWTFSDADGVAYTTGCRLIDLDVPPPPPPGHARP